MTQQYGPHDEDDPNSTDFDDSDPNDNKVIHRKVFTVRPLTPTRKAIELVVVQRVNDENQLTSPTLTRRGKVDTYIESWQFARDYGVQWIAASVYMLDLLIKTKTKGKS